MAVEVRMTNLFAQLGLDSSEAGIAAFIKSHQLPKDINMLRADFWNDAQRQFLIEQVRMDSNWAIVIDQLSEALHASDVHEHCPCHDAP